MKMESFQVDIILSSLKELQQGNNGCTGYHTRTHTSYLFSTVEKLRKEKVLAEEYGKRKQLEAKLEAGSYTVRHFMASLAHTHARTCHSHHQAHHSVRKECQDEGGDESG